MTTTGTPAATLSDTGALPSGVTFTPNANGTATLAGTPAAGSQGTYTLTIKATNSAGTATQSFVLTVNSGLAITSAASASATSGTAFSFTVTTTGTPTPTLTEAGALPSGVTFTANTNGTATLAGTPAATAKGAYPITFTAHNSTGTASQAFMLTVNNKPGFSSAAAVTETAGTAFNFTVATTGYPVPKLTAADPARGGELLRQRQRDRIAVGYDRDQGRDLHPGRHRDQRGRLRQPDDHADGQGGGDDGAGADLHQPRHGHGDLGYRVHLPGQDDGLPDHRTTPRT